MSPVLDIKDLSIAYRTPSGDVRAASHVNLTINKGEVVGLCGESGSGKSTLAYGACRLLRPPAVITGGSVLYSGARTGTVMPVDIMRVPPRDLRAIRWRDIAIVFQSAMNALNPVLRVRDQITDAMEAHLRLHKDEANEKAARLLDLVGIPRERLRSYPHELSGGMRQRVMIAMAVSCNPDVLIADEPTTALDVTIQAQILNLIKKLREDFGTAVVLITHDMGVVADMADRIAVMYAGRIVEQGTQRELFYDPQHPYTWGLLGSIARLDRPRPRRLAAIPGLPPSLMRLPAGCAFGDRCGHRFERCSERPLLLDRVGDGHLDACHLSRQEKHDVRDATIHPELVEEKQ
jgi:oligopeptide/dipeptide ABC transporter ATP-binding protein